MKKCTLLLDGNYFLYSRLYVLPKSKKKSIIVDGKKNFVKLLDDKKEMDMFMHKLAIDFASEMRKFKELVNRVVFAVDSKSWRKNLYSEYKANRKLSDDINIDNAYKIMNEFILILKNKGIIVEKVPNAESDDIIFVWSTYLNSLGEDCIIWTGDKDLKQLVNYNNATESFTLWYDSTHNIMNVYPGFDRWLEHEDDEDEIDIFDIKDDDDLVGPSKKQLIKNFIKFTKLKIEKVFCDEFVFKKILIGDKSDNIPSVILKPSKNNKVKFKISENKAQKILNIFKEKNRRFSTSYLFNESYKNEIVEYIKKVMNIDISSSDILEKLERNINLILLHVESIPEEIQKSIFDLIKEHYRIKINDFEILTSSKLILENTEYRIEDIERKIDVVIKNKALF